MEPTEEQKATAVAFFTIYGLPALWTLFAFSSALFAVWSVMGILTQHNGITLPCSIAAIGLSLLAKGVEIWQRRIR